MRGRGTRREGYVTTRYKRRSFRLRRRAPGQAGRRRRGLRDLPKELNKAEFFATAPRAGRPCGSPSRVWGEEGARLLPISGRRSIKEALDNARLALGQPRVVLVRRPPQAMTTANGSGCEGRGVWRPSRSGEDDDAGGQRVCEPGARGAVGGRVCGWGRTVNGLGRPYTNQND